MQGEDVVDSVHASDIKQQYSLEGSNTNSVCFEVVLSILRLSVHPVTLQKAYRAAWLVVSLVRNA